MLYQKKKYTGNIVYYYVYVKISITTTALCLLQAEPPPGDAGLKRIRHVVFFDAGIA